MDVRSISIYFRTAIFMALSFIVIQTMNIPTYAADLPESIPLVLSDVTESEVFIPETDSTPPDSVPELEPEPDEVPLPPHDVLDSGPIPSSAIRPSDMTFNPANLTLEQAVFQIRFCMVFLVYGIIPLCIAVFLVWQFYRWVSGLIVRAV